MHKFKKGRIEDGVFDSALLIILLMISNGSYGAMVVSMIASLVVSIYLLASPPKFFKAFMASKEVKKTVEELKGFAKPNSSKKKTDVEDLKFD